MKQETVMGVYDMCIHDWRKILQDMKSASLNIPQQWPSKAADASTLQGIIHLEHMTFSSFLIKCGRRLNVITKYKVKDTFLPLKNVDIKRIISD
jgi:hypothetical protein